MKVYLNSFDGLYLVKVICYFKDDLIKSVIRAKIEIIDCTDCGYCYHKGEVIIVTPDMIVKVIRKGDKYSLPVVASVHPSELGLVIQD